ncbi:MAG: hypothetical protein SFW35_01410 [Chitinophagales bacterium]|nr:hypothetical protein [Chitinophagales bacterium]
MKSRSILSFLFICSLLSCNFQNHHTSYQHISLSDVSELITTSRLRPNPWNLDSFNCKILPDTIYTNSHPVFDSAVMQLQLKFADIDKKKSSLEARQYCKALILADFVYATFSFQLFGPKYGFAADSNFMAIRNSWSQLPLDTCYQLGNSNTFSVYCSERTSFFLRLSDKLLSLKGRNIIIPNGVHEFPLLTIGGKEYIIDPYDPFVICDTISGNLMDYSYISSDSSCNTCLPYRTKRKFGESRQLVSIGLITKLDTEYENSSCFCCELEKYMQENWQYLTSLIKPCFSMPDVPNFSNMHIVPNARNHYAIPMQGRVDGSLNALNDIKRYYTADSCSQL